MVMIWPLRVAQEYSKLAHVYVGNRWMGANATFVLVKYI